MSQAEFQCSECGLHYRDAATATACEVFCRTHQACSLEIAAQAIENEDQL